MFAFNMVIVAILSLPTLQGVYQLVIALKKKKICQNLKGPNQKPIISHESLEQVSGSAVLDQTCLILTGFLMGL